MTRTRRLTVMTAGTLAAGLLTACSGPSFDFRQDDPIGYTACRDAVAADELAEGTDRDELIGEIAAAAAASESADIRDTVSPPVDASDLETIGAEDDEQYTVEIDELLAACEEVGFEADDVEVE